jgi:hypothetical protein
VKLSTNKGIFFFFPFYIFFLQKNFLPFPGIVKKKAKKKNRRVKTLPHMAANINSPFSSTQFRGQYVETGSTGQTFSG